MQRKLIIGRPVWSQDKVFAVLSNKVARAALNGQASPVAARVLDRLEADFKAAKRIEAMIAEELQA